MKNFSWLIICLIPYVGWSQTPTEEGDSTQVLNRPVVVEKTADNSQIKEIETYAERFVPRKASLYAAIVPGAGQIYNKKYWKLPLVYGGFVAFGLVIDHYDSQYKLYRSELFKILEDSNYRTPLRATEDQLRSGIDKSRRERDFYMIMAGLFYLLQIADAHIDAHLKEFDLNPDLQVSIDPSIEPNAFATYQAGLSLKLKFR